MCCDIFKLRGYAPDIADTQGVTMTAFAEVQSPTPPRELFASPRASDRLVCSICADSMVAAEASALVSDDEISYLWTCETCGHGFVTKHKIRKLVAREC